MNIQDSLCLITGYLEILLSAGLALGWPSLQYALQKEGFFSYLCINQPQNNATKNSNSSTNSTALSPTCSESEASFNLVFTIAVFSGYGFQILLGYLYDRFGTWKFRSIIVSLFTIGTFFLAFATPRTSYFLYPSLMLLELGGAGILTSNMQIANLGKPIKGLLLALINGLLASSVLVFFTVKKGYEAGIKLQHMLYFFPMISAFLWIRTFLLMPRTFIPIEYEQSKMEYGYKEWKCFKRRQISKQFVPMSLLVVGASSNLIEMVMERKQTKQTNDVSFVSCIKNTLFWTNVFHFSVVSFRVSFVFGILQSWLNSFVAGPEAISKLTDNLGIILLCSIFVAPLNGIVFDAVARMISKKTKDEKLTNLKASAVSLSIVSFCCVMLSLMAVLLNPYGTFVFVVFCRSFSLGGAITFLSVNFPAQHIGKLAGLTFFVYGVTALLQYPLLQLALAFDPTFYYVHIGKLILAVLTFGHPFMIYMSSRKYSTSPGYVDENSKDFLKVSNVAGLDVNANKNLAIENEKV